MTGTVQAGGGSRDKHLLVIAAFAISTTILGFCNVLRPSAGGDQSWSLGITEAVERHLFFGADIVFTYGPLGYLVMGSATPATALTIALWHVLFLVLFCMLAIILTQNIALGARIAVLSMLGLAVDLAAPRTTVVVGGIIIVATMLISDRSRLSKYRFLAFGTMGGILSATKYSFTIEIVSAAMLFIILRDRQSVVDRVLDTYFFLLGFLAALGSVFHVMAHSITSGLADYLGLIVPATAIVVFGREKRWQGALALALVLNFAVVLIFKSGAASYLTQSFQVAAGYSSSMSNTWGRGTVDEMWCGIALAVVASGTALLARGAIGIAGVLAFAFIVFLNFKEGYVRQDPSHLVEFILPLLIVIAACVSRMRSTREVAVGMAAYSFGFMFLAVEQGLFLQQAGVPPYSLSEIMVGDAMSNHLFDMIGTIDRPLPSAWFTELLKPDLLDTSAVNALKHGSVHVEESEASLVFANHLSWHPEPVFQSYSAYTAALDGLDAAAMRASDARILLDVEPIDGRLFMGETPLARSTLLCDFAPDPALPETKTNSGASYVVLVNQHRNRCSMLGPVKQVRTSWRGVLPLDAMEPGTGVMASIKIKPSALGYLEKLVFKSPAVFVHDDASGRDARVLPDVTGNTFLLSPDVTSNADFLRLYECSSGGGSRHITFRTDGEWAYQAEVDVTLQKVRYQSCIGTSVASR